MTDPAPPPDTTDPAYTERLAASVALRRGWRRVVDPQIPYRWNLRRLHLGRTLDIGCGVGRNLAHLAAGSVGVDHNTTSIDIARGRGLIAYTPESFVVSTDAVPGSFDSLLFAHVLEHLSLDDAVGLVRHYLPMRREHGAVVVICPQQRGQQSDPTHITYLTQQRIGGLLTSLGLRVERADSFPFPTFAGRWFTHNETVVVAH
jgi:2-polyprenyl-3-methyl-5-hydroxy-6-metoxy-1,4-benzoquinol methylase